MRNGLRSVLLGVCSFFSVSIAGGETLTEALVSAYRTNLNLGAAEAETRVTAENLSAAQAAWLPTAQLQGSINQRFINSKTDGSSTASASRQLYYKRQDQSAGLLIQQNIYNGGATMAGEETARQQVLESQATFEKIESAILLKAIETYAAVIFNQEKIKLAVANQRMYDEQLKNVQARFELGDLTLTDVAQVEARLAEATAGRIEAERGLESAQAEYISVIGHAPSNLMFPEDPSFLPSNKAEALQIGIENNKGLVAAAAAERAARASVGIAEAGFEPVVDLSVGMERSSEIYSHSRTYEGYTKATVTIPINLSGAVQSSVRKARQTTNQKRYTRMAVRRELESAVSQAFDAFHTAKARTVQFAAQIKSSKLALEGMRLEEELGNRTMTDVLNAEKEHYDGLVGLARANSETLTAHYKLLNTMGVLTVATLRLPVEPYNPQAYVDEIAQAAFNTEIPEVREEVGQETLQQDEFSRIP